MIASHLGVTILFVPDVLLVPECSVVVRCEVGAVGLDVVSRVCSWLAAVVSDPAADMSACRLCVTVLSEEATDDLGLFGGCRIVLRLVADDVMVTVESWCPWWSERACTAVCDASGSDDALVMSCVSIVSVERRSGYVSEYSEVGPAVCPGMLCVVDGML